MSLGISVAVDVNHWRALKRRMKEREKKKESNAITADIHDYAVHTLGHILDFYCF